MVRWVAVGSELSQISAISDFKKRLKSKRQNNFSNKWFSIREKLNQLDKCIFTMRVYSNRLRTGEN